MKIAFFTHSTWGMYRFRMPLLQALVAKGHEVVVMTPPDEYFKYIQEKIPDITMVEMRHMQRANFSPLTNMKLLLESYRYLKNFQPDLLILNTIKPILLGQLLAKQLGLKSLVIFEGFGYSASNSNPLGWAIKKIYMQATQAANTIIFLNKEDASDYHKRFESIAERFRVVQGCGINIEHYSPKEKTTEKGKKPFTFLHCSRFLKEKGLHLIVDACRILREEGFDFECLFLGKIDRENPTAIKDSDLQSWIDEGIIRYEGFHDELFPYFQQADATLYPSYYREGLPQANLESLAMGLPLITTDMPGCRATVEHRKNGFLIKPQNLEALVSAMREMMQLSQDERKEMSKHSRKLAEQKFSLQVIIPQYIKIIEQTANA